jgi:hypothetical protein
MPDGARGSSARTDGRLDPAAVELVVRRVSGRRARGSACGAIRWPGRSRSTRSGRWPQLSAWVSCWGEGSSLVSRPAWSRPGFAWPFVPLIAQSLVALGEGLLSPPANTDAGRSFDTHSTANKRNRKHEAQ